MALELKYHCPCLTALYNREKAHIAAKSKEDFQLSHKNETFPCIFSELATYIIENSNNSTSDKPTSFKLAELIQDKPDTNQARLKERILSAIPGLTAHQEGRDILLTF